MGLHSFLSLACENVFAIFQQGRYREGGGQRQWTGDKTWEGEEMLRDSLLVLHHCD